MSSASREPDDVDRYFGPYERWLYGEGKPYAFPNVRKFQRGWLSGIVEWKECTTPPKGGSYPQGHDRPLLVVPTQWRGDPVQEDFRTTFTPVLSWFDAPPGRDSLQAFVNNLNAGLMSAGVTTAEREAFPRLRVNFPVAEAAVHGFPDGTIPDPEEIVWKTSVEDRRRRLTIVALIDDGIPFAHRNFRTTDGKGSRIAYCWLQSVEAAIGRDPATVAYGAEFTRNDIERLIAAYGHDEDLLYRAGGAIDIEAEYGDPINRHASHGGVTLDLAAGYQPLRGDEKPRDDVAIIVVQLPNVIAWDTSGFGKDSFMLAAFHYVFERAERLARASGADECPLVVNLSYGASGGPHDRQGARTGVELEEAIDQMVAARRRRHPTAVVMPAGNNFSDRLHAVIDREDLAVGSVNTLHWRLQPCDRTPSFLEIWFPMGTEAGEFGVTLISPAGKSGIPPSSSVDTVRSRGNGDEFDLGRLPDDEFSGRPVPGQISADLFRGNRRRVLVCLAPTEPDDPVLAAPAGAWTIRIERKTGEDLPDGPITAWIQRDENLDPRAGARQSYFDQPGYSRFGEDGRFGRTDPDGTTTRRFGTVNGIATALSVVPVAGYAPSATQGYLPDRGGSPHYSSAGPIFNRGPFGKAVECAAMSDHGPSHPGVVAAGTRSGALGVVTGTSTAAPQVARSLAHAFATRPIGEIVRSERSNYVDLLSGVEVPDTTAGDLPEHLVAVPHPRARLGSVLVAHPWRKAP